jgi:hypothetical protein
VPPRRKQSPLTARTVPHSQTQRQSGCPFIAVPARSITVQRPKRDCVRFICWRLTRCRVCVTGSRLGRLSTTLGRD